LTGESARLSDDAVPSISHIAIAATIPNDSGASTINKQWLVPLSIVGLVTFVLVGVGLTVRAVKKERLATRPRAEFLTAVTHELKTPLASIRLLVDVLQDGRVVPRKRLDHQRALASEAARLTMLVENVLDLGRVERGERSYDRRHEDISDVIDNSVRLYAPLATRADMDIDVSLTKTSNEEPILVDADRGTIVQVVLNLLENARRYPSAGMRVNVRGYLAASNRYKITVRDFGPGVRPDERETIFAKFSSGRAAAQGGNPGVGLGLYLARAIVRDHGGDLTCMDPTDQGNGACFRLLLPAIQVPCSHLSLESPKEAKNDCATTPGRG
jgi:two-component system phosphate regulon sensor histidine kinase PhoR